MNVTELFALANDSLQAIIIIFGSAVVLYNVRRTRRSSIARAFCLLVSFVVIVYLTELLASRIVIIDSAVIWRMAGWVGIALVPAAQYHLSDALLTYTGYTPRYRHHFLLLTYATGLLFIALSFWTPLIVTFTSNAAEPVYAQRGAFFFVFLLYFWGIAALSIINVWRARQRTITSATRRRLTTTLLAFGAAPLGVFPYMLLANSSTQSVPLIIWLMLIMGNLVVGFMFAVLTADLAYFGAASPDRVVRVRLYKFMARVPMAASIMLLVYILVERTSPFLGLPTETALGFTLVVTVMLVQWAVHTFKRPLERLFQLNNDPDVRRIQLLSERLVTTSDLHQFLESVLSATCEALRTPTAFVAAITDDGPKVESVIGSLDNAPQIFKTAAWNTLPDPPLNGQSDLAEGEFKLADPIVWENYWIWPLYNRKQELILGIFGVQARADEPDLADSENAILARLIIQAAIALEDRVLQQTVFTAIEELLLQVTALQERRSAATFSALPVLTEPETAELLADPDFNAMVRDALKDYWGGPRLTESPLMRLNIVNRALAEHGNNPANALRAILVKAIEQQKPEGERSMTTAEWILYNILELKFIEGRKVREIARRLAMSESDYYRKQRVAIENVARAIVDMETGAAEEEGFAALNDPQQNELA